MSDAELKPCPWCRHSDDLIEDARYGETWICCMKCFARGPQVTEGTIPNAKQAWNNRFLIEPPFDIKAVLENMDKVGIPKASLADEIVKSVASFITISAIIEAKRIFQSQNEQREKHKVQPGPSPKP